MRSPKHSIVGVLAAAALLTLSACGPTAPPAPSGNANDDLVALVPDDIADAGKIVVATSGALPPEGFTGDDGELEGYEIEIVEGVAGLLGLEVDWQITDFASYIPGLQAGRSDLAVGQMGITAERAESVDFVTLILVNQAFAAKSDSGLSDITIEDLCGETVAIVQGSRQQEFGEAQSDVCVTDGDEPIDLAVFQNSNEAWLALQSDRADIYWSGATNVGYLVSQVEGSEIVGNHLEPYPTGIALAKGSDLGPAIEAALQQLIDDGDYQEILDTYGVGANAIDAAELNPEITW